MNWQERSLLRLQESSLPMGGWGYLPGRSAAAEPTAWACLALRATGSDSLKGGLTWLAAQQKSDGGVPATSSVPNPCWPTALAALAWIRAAAQGHREFHANADRAVAWLLRTEGKPFKSNPALCGHNTQLKAWPWVEGTHSWIEPTAYAVLALRAAGKESHPRVRQAVSLLLDRAVQGGGWNYGNNKMLGTVLRPFPAQTGMVLAALWGEPADGKIETGLRFLEDEQPRAQTPISLAWGLIGAGAWQSPPRQAQAWLAACAARLGAQPPQPLFDAMLLVADAAPCPLLTPTLEMAHGA